MTANSSVEFLIWLLIAASVIAVIAKRIGIPYTVALVLGGLLLSVVHLSALAPLHQGNRPDWLTPDVILTLFLPALLFEGSLKIDLRHITTDIVPLLLLATLGVLIATFVTGFVIYYAVGMSLIVALVFGSMVSATDPISVLSIFKDVAVEERLSVLVEGESLLNDGTAVALFQILLASAVGGGVGLVMGAGQFLLSVVGGALLGLALGYCVSKLTKRIDDAQIEITVTTILAYGTFLLARHLHLSGVIATVAAGLVIGNFAAKAGMSARTLTALRSFWEYASFIINSIVFLLIGLEVRLGGVLRAWKPILIAAAAIFLSRILSVYTLVPFSNLFSKRIPFVWQHVLVWGGLRGALSLALALSLDRKFPYRDQILNLTFGVVVFSILVQGLSIKPLLRMLRSSLEALHE
jgi:CPA1 family monovalent cation:H+ antiporter